MNRALFTGVTGLRVHQVRLDVVATNIANVNTTGYRSSRALFQDLFSQTLRGGTAPTGSFGGTNPLQVGLGVGVGSIGVDHSQGSLITTGNASDLAIQGAGFFVLSDGSGEGYARDGSFELNANGLLVQPGTGMIVQGYLADDQGIIDTNVAATNVEVPVGTSGIVRATTNVSLLGNLNSDSPEGTSVVRNIVVYDSLGTERNVELTFTKDAADNSWTWVAHYESLGTAIDDTDDEDGTLVFDSDGTLPALTTANVVIDNHRMPRQHFLLAR